MSMLEYKQLSIKEILEKDRTGELVLPNFQRDFVWDREKQKGLLASLLVGLPIGNILLVKGKRGDFPALRLGLTANVEPKDECEFLLDGQQRLSCLKSIFSDLFASREDWKSSWNDMYGLLRNRWFLKIKPPSDGIDVWGWNNLRYMNNLSEYEPDQLEDFIVCRRILAKDEGNTNAHFHPAFKILDEHGNEITGKSSKIQRLAERYSQEGMVPLFNVFTEPGPASIHGRTLARIASLRMDQLRAEVSDGKVSLKKILGHLRDDVESINDQEELAELWRELSSEWAAQVRIAIENLIDQDIIVTILPTDEIGRAAAIFERINEGGTPLSNFDLIVAKTARTSQKSLAQELKELIAREIPISQALIQSHEPPIQWRFEDMAAIKDNSISKVVAEQFLNLLSLVVYSGQSADVKVEYIKQKKILALTREQILENYEVVFSALINSFAFLQFRCGLIDVNDLIYKLMILPIGFVLAKDRDAWENAKKLNKIEYWYWLSLFSGRYRDSQNERCVEDVKSLYDWLNGQTNSNPFKSYERDVFNKEDYSDEQTLLNRGNDPPPSAVRNAMLQYILSTCPRDFLTQESTIIKPWEIAASNKKLEEHHIIPLASATSIGESSRRIREDRRSLLNSPLNLTLISKEANQAIGNLQPGNYLSKLTLGTIGSHLVSQTMLDIINSRSGDCSQDDYYANIFHERFNWFKQTVICELEHLLD